MSPSARSDEPALSTSAHEDVISGRRTGPGAALARAALAAMSVPYRVAVAARNARYDRGYGVRRLSVPVISVGNVTVGGTGKTPLVLWLCEHLCRLGRRPAVVSRGYRAAAPPASTDAHGRERAERRADELLLLRRRRPDVASVASPDRVRGGLDAIERHGADVIVLDDGFQHRRLARDLDIVALDATRPFGYDRVLPRGLLREPLAVLRRADALIVTRANQVTPDRLDAIERRLRAVAPDCPLVRAVHEPSGFTNLHGAPIGAPAPSQRPLLFAGIARPLAFEQTVRSLGLTPVGARYWPDHHAYTADDVAALAELVRRASADLLLTTEKDAVKLAALPDAWPCPVAVLRVDIAFRGDGGTIVARLVERCLRAAGASHAAVRPAAG